MTVDLTTDELQALAEEEAWLAKFLASLEERMAELRPKRIPLELLHQVQEARDRHRLAVRARMLLAERAK